MATSTTAFGVKNTKLGHYIGGNIFKSARSELIEVFDPSNGELICEVAAGNAEDVDGAVVAARQCFDKRTWRSQSANDRANTIWSLAELISAHAQEFAELEVRDNGMPLMFAKATIASLVNGLRYYAVW